MGNQTSGLNIPYNSSVNQINANSNASPQDSYNSEISTSHSDNTYKIDRSGLERFNRFIKELEESKWTFGTFNICGDPIGIKPEKIIKELHKQGWKADYDLCVIHVRK